MNGYEKSVNGYYNIIIVCMLLRLSIKGDGMIRFFKNKVVLLFTILFVLFLCVMFYFYMYITPRFNDNFFVAPGEICLDLDGGEEYVLWDAYRCKFENKYYNNSVIFPLDSAVISVHDITNDKNVKLEYKNTMTYSQTGLLKKSVVFFTIDAPAKIKISVSGNFDPRVMNVAKSFTKVMVICLIPGLVLGILTMIFGLYYIQKKGFSLLGLVGRK